MDWVSVGSIVGGLAILVVGADMMVRGASRLAVAVGISPLVVGLTVVAYGTSAPEIAVSVRSSLAGAPELLLGNVVGSNICNVLLVLGSASLVTPLAVHRRLVRLEVPIMIGVSALVAGLAWNGVLGRAESLLLFVGSVIYTIFAVRQGRSDGAPEVAEVQELAAGVERRSTGALLAQVGMIGIGLAGLVMGSGWLVDGAVTLAMALGLSELVVGLTIVAIGTSLPEVATSVVAAVRGERDLAVGNVVGSNLLNLLAVLGAAGIVGSQGIPVSDDVMGLHLPVMLASTIACLPLFFTGQRITRAEGALLLTHYASYLTYLVLDAIGSPLSGPFKQAVLWVLVPITVLVIGVPFVKTLSRERAGS